MLLLKIDGKIKEIGVKVKTEYGKPSKIQKKLAN
jgi:hypothetical protein